MLDAENRSEIKALDKEIERARMEQTAALRANSEALASLADLKHDKRALESQLDGATRLVSAGRKAMKDREAEAELESLRQLAAMQQAQLTQLRDQIMRLSRKTGHVLPPSKQGQVERLPPI